MSFLKAIHRQRKPALRSTPLQIYLPLKSLQSPLRPFLRKDKRLPKGPSLPGLLHTLLPHKATRRLTRSPRLQKNRLKILTDMSTWGLRRTCLLTRYALSFTPLVTIMLKYPSSHHYKLIQLLSVCLLQSKSVPSHRGRLRTL
jgi:hypothetical protein